MFGRFTHGVTDDSFFTPPSAKIASRTTWDLQYSLRWEALFGEGRDTTFAVGAINLFDTLSRLILTIGGSALFCTIPEGGGFTQGSRRRCDQSRALRTGSS
jgi:hypothetical protein